MYVNKQPSAGGQFNGYRTTPKRPAIETIMPQQIKVESPRAVPYALVEKRRERDDQKPAALSAGTTTVTDTPHPQ
ncbi:hypothetical protein ACOMHN_026780 [Nucella lapillus]